MDLVGCLKRYGSGRNLEFSSKVMKMGISDAIQEKGVLHDHLLSEPH